MKQTFIKTSDEATANNLKSIGYKLINCQGGIWTFINDAKLKFSSNGKVIYSNKIEM